jgi:hypothetical protein
VSGRDRAGFARSVGPIGREGVERHGIRQAGSSTGGAALDGHRARVGATDLLWWAGPIITGGRYYLCLRRVRQELLECDRKAKEDTGCVDGNLYA